MIRNTSRVVWGRGITISQRLLSTQQVPLQTMLLNKYYNNKETSKSLMESIKLAQGVLPPEWESIDIDNSKNDDLLTLDPLLDHQAIGDSNIPSSVARSYYPESFHANAMQSRVSKLVTMANKIYMQTQVDPRYITSKLEMKPLVMKRVSNQTAKGKIRSHYALCVVGDRQGMIGLGEGKSRSNMGKAIAKAHWDAIRNLLHVDLFEGRTIYSDLDHRYHGVKLFLKKRSPGSGLRVHHTIFEMCQLVGIRDLSAEVYKSRNDMNVAKGFLEALTEGQRPLHEVALGRGKKIVDVKRVYYSG